MKQLRPPSKFRCEFCGAGVDEMCRSAFSDPVGTRVFVINGEPTWHTRRYVEAQEGNPETKGVLGLQEIRDLFEPYRLEMIKQWRALVPPAQKPQVPAADDIDSLLG